MKMKKLATLGLGIMLTAAVLTPVSASEAYTSLRTKTDDQSYTECKPYNISFSGMEKSDTFNKEDYLNSMKEKLSKLEEDFGAGNITEDQYNAAKERISKSMEAMENSDLSIIAKKSELGIFKGSLSKEEILGEYNTRLSELETKYNNGDIDQDKYQNLKDQINKRIEAIENGESLMKFDLKAPTQEEMLEKLNESLVDAETKFNNGDISEDRYNEYKEKIGAMIEKIENGENILVDSYHVGKRAKAILSLSKEERIEMLQSTLAKLEKAFNEGALNQEKYDRAKESINNMIQTLENSDETTDIVKNRYQK